MKKIIAIALLSLSACTTTPATYKYYLDGKGLDEQRLYNFQHCHGYGCKFITGIEFSEQDWQDISALFTPTPQTPQAERARLKPAIAIFERKTGIQAGTSGDKWGTFRKIGDKQHDCVDESTNTTIYLSLLEQRGLLKHHKIEPPSVRLPLIHAGHWPHQTAVISEIQTSKFFAIDSWFHDNGALPEIVPLKQWKEGWKPNRNDDS